MTLCVDTQCIVDMGLCFGYIYDTQRVYTRHEGSLRRLGTILDPGAAKAPFFCQIQTALGAQKSLVTNDSEEPLFKILPL